MQTMALTSLSLGELNEDEMERVAEEGYHLKEIISVSSCSVVYNCEYFRKHSSEDLRSGLPRKLVCKVMEAVRAPKDFTKKFMPRELAILQRIRSARLKHINLVHSALQYKNKVMVFTKYAELGTLYDFITQYTLTERWARTWFRQLAVGLYQLHKMEVVHRDIKCENIILTDTFDLQWSDFGFSRLTIDNKGKPIYSSTFCGSMGYVAPEILKGVPYIPKLIDVWALGIVLFIMLNGTMPFLQQSVTKLHKAQTKKDYKFRPSVESKISDYAKSLVSRMIEPRWFERITTEEILKSPWLKNNFPNGKVLTPIEEEINKNAEQMKDKILSPMYNLIHKNFNSDYVEILIDEIDKSYEEEEATFY